jgi:alkylated DNA repair protein alkB family protein 6
MTVINIKSLIRQVRRDKASSTLLETHQSSDASCEHLEGFSEDVPVPFDFPAELYMKGLPGVRICNEFLSVAKSATINNVLRSQISECVVLRGRRCIPYGGRVLPEGLIHTDDIPSWLQLLMTHVSDTTLKHMGLPAPNHALVNVYNPGDGIMAHEDGPAYTPYAAVISLGSGCVFDFVSKSLPRESIAQIYLPVGSLMIFTSDAYEQCLHEFRFSKFDAIDNSVSNHLAIKEYPERLGGSSYSDDVLSRGERISITMRHVPNYIS